MAATLDGESTQMFCSMRSVDVRSLAGPVLDVSVPAGVRLTHEGQATGTFFVIRSGTAELWRSDRRVGMLGRGDCFGEIDPASNAPQRASVVASSTLRLLAFSSFGIERLCCAIPDARERILASLPDDSAEPSVLHRT
jgi:CRP-like cAMP-binding protein